MKSQRPNSISALYVDIKMIFEIIGLVVICIAVVVFSTVALIKSSNKTRILNESDIQRERSRDNKRD